MMELWLPDGASYLADLRHPLARRELEVLQKAQGLPYNHTMSDRERREFDRRMIRKYGRRFPPPERTPWALLAYDCLDRMENMAQKKERAGP